MMTRVSDLEAIDQTLSDYYFSQAMDSVRDLLDGAVDGGRYVAPERRTVELDWWAAAEAAGLTEPRSARGQRHHAIIVDELVRFRRAFLDTYQAREVRGAAD
jgi:hypothetical protein